MFALCHVAVSRALSYTQARGIFHTTDFIIGPLYFRDKSRHKDRFLCLLSVVDATATYELQVFNGTRQRLYQAVDVIIL